MASSDKNPKETPSPAPNAAPAAPPKEDIFDMLRRYSEMNVSAILHNLIGLPSNLTPPTSNWIIDDDEPAASSSAAGAGHPPLERASSSQIADEVRKLRDPRSDGSGEDNGSSGAAVGSSQAPAGGAGAAANGGSANTSPRRLHERMYLLPPPLEPLFAPAFFAAASSIMQHAGAHIETLEREIFGDASAPAQVSYAREDSAPSREHSRGDTELDFYETSGRPLPPPQTSAFEMARRAGFPSQPVVASTAETRGQPGDGSAVVATSYEFRSSTGVDGVTRTRKVEVTRYADGREERSESEDVKYPPAVPSRRIIEIEEGPGNDTRNDGGSVMQELQKRQERAAGRGWFWSSGE